MNAIKTTLAILDTFKDGDLLSVRAPRHFLDVLAWVGAAQSEFLTCAACEGAKRLVACDSTVYGAVVESEREVDCPVCRGLGVVERSQEAFTAWAKERFWEQDAARYTEEKPLMTPENVRLNRATLDSLYLGTGRELKWLALLAQSHYERGDFAACGSALWTLFRQEAALEVEELHRAALADYRADVEAQQAWAA